MDPSLAIICIFLVFIILIIAIILVIGITRKTIKEPLNIFTHNINKNNEIISVDQPYIEEDELITMEENELPYEDFLLYSNIGKTLKMAILITPAHQPPLNAEARKYRGFHITGFPTQDMPSDYNLVEVMKGFQTTNDNWNLMNKGITTSVKKAVSKNLVLMMIYGATTLTKLRKYLMTKGWSRPWNSDHISLGYIDPADAADPNFFKIQKQWFVQLVINSGPPSGRGWPANQRVLLNIA
jgi:hypothetical protein